MTDSRTHTLTVPGARLHYEVRGRGPVLLMICGGIYDAAGYAALADRLADAYTVVTYDRRGNSRSPLPRRAALALARRLGTPPVRSPGGHGGFGTDPGAFASTLRSVV
jgi:pimeloyl-ACP methyl ester carboxylesterase